MCLRRCVKKAHTHELCIYTGTSLYIHGLIGILSNVSMPVSSFTYPYRPTLTKCGLRPNNEDAPARNFACRPGEVGLQATATNQGRIQIVLATGTVVENVFMYTYW